MSRGERQEPTWPSHRREFVRGGVAAFTVSFAAPAFLSDLARAQGRSRRNLVVLYLSGGNDALSTLIPYTDRAVLRAAARRSRSRRRTCCRSAAISAGNALGLQPAADRAEDRSSTPAGWRSFSAPATRTRAARISRAPISGRPAIPRSPQGTGWLGRYLDTLPSPVDPLTAWSTVRETPRTLLARTVGVPSIPSVARLRVREPELGRPTRAFARSSALRIASHLPADQPHLAFVNAHRAGRVRDARSRRAGRHLRAVGDLSEQRLRAGAARRRRRDGQGHRHEGVLGADRRLRHARRRRTPTPANGAYTDLMATLNDGLIAFYRDLREPGAAARHADPAVLGVRPPHQRERQQRHRPRRRRPDDGDRRHGPRRHLRHRRRTCSAAPDNPTLENNGGDVRHETDFRSVYAQGDRLVAGRGLERDSRRRTSGRARRHSL